MLIFKTGTHLWGTSLGRASALPPGHPGRESAAVPRPGHTTAP